MDFGVRPTEGGHTYEAAVQQAIRAEELGFHGVYLAEHHGFPDAPYWPSPLLGLAGIATRTSSIRVGTNISLLPLANPVRLAGEIAQLDVMTGGRTVFGFGVGWRDIEFKAFGIPRSERGARMTEYLNLLNILFEPGPTTFDGQFHQFSDFELTPRPIQSPRPDFLVGGESRPAFDRAANFAEGWVSPGGTIEENAEHVNTFEAEGGGRVVITTGGVIAREDEDTALNLANRFIALQKQPHVEEGNPHAESIDPEFDSNTELREYVNNRVFIAGTPDQCIEKIEKIQAATGCDELILRISCKGWSHEDTTETLELLGTEVLPSF